MIICTGTSLGELLFYLVRPQLYLKTLERRRKVKKGKKVEEKPRSRKKTLSLCREGKGRQLVEPKL